MTSFFDKIFVSAKVHGYNFIAQYNDKARCGQVAIYNALIWLGRKPDMQHITKNSKFHPRYGTPITGVTEYLRRKRINFSYRTRLKMRDIEKNLALGHIIIYLYCPTLGNAHYTLLIEDKKKYLLAINDAPTGAEYNLPLAAAEKKYYNEMAKKYALYNHRDRRVYPQGWIIRLKKSKKK